MKHYQIFTHTISTENSPSMGEMYTFLHLRKTNKDGLFMSVRTQLVIYGMLVALSMSVQDGQGLRKPAWIKTTLTLGFINIL